MREILPNRLWQGSALDLQNVAGVLALEVQAVVDLAASEAPVAYPRDIVYVRLPIDDGAENPAVLLRLAVQTTAELIRAEIPTLVACSAGMSRSPAIVAAALAIARRIPIEETLRAIALHGAIDVSPGLLADIRRIVDSSA